MLSAAKHLLFLVESQQKQTPLPHRRSKLRSAERTRDREDIVGPALLVAFPLKGAHTRRE
jgi:hypothetical protein